MSTAGKPDPEYVKARRILLDALSSLSVHSDALVLVGAQAIYLHVGAGELAVAPYRTDGDLVIQPRELPDSPRLEEALADGGFTRTDQPGIWTRDDVELDLLVPAAVGGPGRRGARLGVHGNRAARKARGLEGALIDKSPMEIGALDDDARRFKISVAGPAALLVSKLHKIADRTDQADRLGDKDALDVLRLLQGIGTQELADSLQRLLAQEVSGEVTRQALDLLLRLFGAEDGTGVEMAVRATEGLEDPATIRSSCTVLAAELLEAVRGGVVSRDPEDPG
jgi:hypothetical protein